MALISGCPISLAKPCYNMKIEIDMEIEKCGKKKYKTKFLIYIVLNEHNLTKK